MVRYNVAIFIAGPVVYPAHLLSPKRRFGSQVHRPGKTLLTRLHVDATDVVQAPMYLLLPHVRLQQVQQRVVKALDSGFKVEDTWNESANLISDSLDVCWVNPQNDVGMRTASALHLIPDNIVYNLANNGIGWIQDKILHEAAEAAVKELQALDRSIFPRSTLIESVKERLKVPNLIPASGCVLIGSERQKERGKSPVVNLTQQILQILAEPSRRTSNGRWHLVLKNMFHNILFRSAGILPSKIMNGLVIGYGLAGI
jgi:hypothetical protein